MKFLCILAFATVSLSANAQQVKKVSQTISLPGNGKWDYLNVNNNRLFVSHGDQVQVVDILTGKGIASITGLSGVHGIAIDELSGTGFISNGLQNNVIVFDNKTYKIVDSIVTGKKPDAIVFEPFSKSVLVGNGGSNSLSVIDAASRKVKATIALEGNPEYIASDNAGTAYVNIEDKSEIAVIDMNTMTLKHYIKLAPKGEEPAGLAIDNEHHLLFAGCGNEKLAIIDIKTEKVISDLKIGEDCDGVAYSPSRKYIYASCKDGSLHVVHQKANGAFELMPAIKTQFGGKTLAIDEASNTVFISTAGLTKSATNAGKMDIVPNTFKILVLK